MSIPSQGREQFRTRLHCSACNSDGFAMWEADEGATDQLGALIRVSSGFVVRGTDKQGGLEIGCLKCGV